MSVRFKISLEDDSIDAIEIKHKSKEIKVQEELVEGLEALKFISNRISEPTPTEIALFQICANIAVAGTNQSAQDFLPAMEDKKATDAKAFDEKIKEVQKKIAVLNLELANLKAKKKLG